MDTPRKASKKKATVKSQIKESVNAESRGKRERVSFSQLRTKLSAGLIPEVAKRYEGRWFTDDGQRVQLALEAGWEFALRSEIAGRVGDKEIGGDSTDLNGRVSRIVNKEGGEDGGAQRGFFMKLKKEFRDADRAEKARQCDLVDEAIRGGSSGGESVDNAYGRDIQMRDEF